MNSGPEMTNGVTIAIKMVINQLSNTAILRPFSVIISAIYSHGIGPSENSNKITNKRINIKQNI